MTSRGIRNNNPGNIKLNAKNAWQGKVAQGTDDTFEQFKDPLSGLRAMAVLLVRHYDKGARSIPQLVSIWAPPNENKTAWYIKAVVRQTGFGEDEQLNLHDPEYLGPLMKAIIFEENGNQPYTDKQIEVAMIRAGVMPAQKPLVHTRTVRGGQLAVASMLSSGGLSELHDQLTQAQDAVSPYTGLTKWAALIFVVLALGGVGLMLYARWDDRRKGLN
jgi:hypothetical protein